jgi:hypothetical protein
MQLQRCEMSTSYQCHVCLFQESIFFRKLKRTNEREEVEAVWLKQLLTINSVKV